MPDFPPNVSRLFPIALGVLCSLGFAQEVPANLKEADSAYRAGQAALASHDLSAARGDFERVVRLAPQAEQGHSALGAVLVSLGETSKGIRELEKALAMKPSDSSAQLNLAVAYEQSGQAAKAVLLFQKLEAAARTGKQELSPGTLASYGRALAGTGQIKPAIARMKEAVARDPRTVEYEDELGTLYA